MENGILTRPSDLTIGQRDALEAYLLPTYRGILTGTPASGFRRVGRRSWGEELWSVCCRLSLPLWCRMFSFVFKMENGLPEHGKMWHNMVGSLCV